jgi:drug/metabolite transporter (DMT)-like permease
MLAVSCARQSSAAHRPRSTPRINGFRFSVNNKKIQGTILFLTSLFLFAVSDATAKYMSAFFAVPLLAWARYVTQLLLMLALTAPGMGRDIVCTGRPWLMIFRGVMQVSSTVFVLLAFRTLPLAETTAFVFITPLLVALLAGPMLGEKLKLRSWLATLTGFAGVLLIVRPGGAMEGIGVAYALGAALCYAMYQILTRKLASSEPPLRQLFYIALVGSVCMSCALPFFWTGIMPSASHALLILSLGVYGGAGHFMLIRAFHQTPASILSPMLYFQLVWAMVLGWVVFGQLPDLLSIIGMLVIGASGLSLALRWPRLRS